MQTFIFVKMPKSYTVEKKLSWHKEKGANLHATSRHLSIDQKQIRQLIVQENKLLQNNYGQISLFLQSVNICKGRKNIPLYSIENMEQAMVWFVSPPFKNE